MEAKDFFEVQWSAFDEGVPAKDKIDKNKVIAAGIGSSSTQMYTLVDGKVMARGDSTLGALPPKGMDVKNIVDFNKKWADLIPLQFKPKGKTFVAMNAVGYAVKDCHQWVVDFCTEKKQAGDVARAGEIKKHVLAHVPIMPNKLKLFADKCMQAAGDDIKKVYPAKLLESLATNMDLKGIKKVLLECKFDKTCAIPGGASWATYVISQTFPKGGNKAKGGVVKEMVANTDAGKGAKNVEVSKKLAESEAVQKALQK
jgi:hypothetical protein